MTPPLPLRAVFAVACALSVALLDTASAYEQYKTSDNETPLRWFSHQAEIWWDDNAPKDLDEATARTVIEASYHKWSNLSCDGTSSPFNFDFVGERACTVGYDDTPGAVNESCVIWVGSSLAWLHGSSVLALTSLTFNDSNGEIIDADLEINDAGFEFVVGACIPPRIDLANTVVHEAGHVLGLDHSKESESTMHSMAPPCETKKADLHPDDLDGYCAMYGPEAPPLPVQPVPPEPSNGSCSTLERGSAPSSGSSPALPVGLGLLLLLLWGVARSRRATGAC